MAVLFSTFNFEGEGLKDLINKMVGYYSEQPAGYCTSDEAEHLSFYPDYAEDSEKNVSKKRLNWFNKIIYDRVDEIRIANNEQDKEDRKYGTYEQQHKVY